MNISAISSSANAAAAQRGVQSTNASNKPSDPAVKPHHHHHHAGGAKGTGALTAGKLTSSGSTPVLDTLI